ncbi:DUF456 domain-containing protein [Halalkalibaculum sp. DA3122]|uniref:DUF456 domain-containing protein n=1 Tax=unclassified Halalkalibaculum TaxID=2964617 RepID=UPI00375519CA
METLLIAIGTILIIVGFVGSFLPIMPGLPFSYAGLLALQLTTTPPFSLQFMITWAIIVVVLMVLDNVIPAYGTKKFGGSAYGIWGSIVGLLAGFFFPPAGIVAGPLLGAFAGELIAGKTTDRAFKSALGSFAGLLASILLKVIAAAMMGYYFFSHL